MWEGVGGCGNGVVGTTLKFREGAKIENGCGVRGWGWVCGVDGCVGCVGWMGGCEGGIGVWGYLSRAW